LPGTKTASIRKIEAAFKAFLLSNQQHKSTEESQITDSNIQFINAAYNYFPGKLESAIVTKVSEKMAEKFPKNFM